MRATSPALLGATVVLEVNVRGNDTRKANWGHREGLLWKFDLNKFFVYFQTVVYWVYFPRKCASIIQINKLLINISVYNKMD